MRTIDETLGEDPAVAIDWAKVPSRWVRIHVSTAIPGPPAEQAKRAALRDGVEARIDHQKAFHDVR